MRPRTQAAILCGGRGERLKPLTDYYQKTMIPIGPKKLPLLAYTMALVKYHGIARVALLTGYRSEEVKRYFGDGSPQKMVITYSEDREDLAGSLNAVANALNNGAVSDCDELLIYYGDMLTELDITRLLAVHRRARADATLVLDNGYTLQVGVATVTDGRVTSFQEKPRMDLNVTTGMMVVGPKAMGLIQKVAGPKKTDLMTDFVPALLKGGGKVAPFYIDKEWFDVGSVRSFEKLNEELVKRPPSYLA